MTENFKRKWKKGKKEEEVFETTHTSIQGTGHAEYPFARVSYLLNK